MYDHIYHIILSLYMATEVDKTDLSQLGPVSQYTDKLQATSGFLIRALDLSPSTPPTRTPQYEYFFSALYSFNHGIHN